MSSCTNFLHGGHGSSSKTTSEPNKTNIAELYFLIQKFLSNGPLERTRQVLMEELEEHKIFQKRLDWRGKEHDRTYGDMEHQFSYIMPDYLLQICSQIGNTSQKDSVENQIKSLLKYTPGGLKNNDYNYKQLFNFITRLKRVPVRDKTLPVNILNMLRGREVSGPVPRVFSVTPKMYEGIRIQRRTVGHLSAVYCLLFDASGKYILTGADDLLIKLWSTHDGRLIASFRGAFSEISDIAINVENSLLAAGSLDRIVRVWSLQTGAPVAILTGITGMITSVNFCPSNCWDLRYLITTSTDGAVSFWTYTYDADNKVVFKLSPTVYQEKIRPGQAQMICSSFSPGGSFLATGSADHNVRVYYMKGDEGPQRILETELHTDRVDSIQWAHSGIRFMSGSKDGSAIVWSFEGQYWKHVYLHMSTKLDSSQKNKVPDDPKKIKVSMVSWDLSDELVVTAVTDHTLKVWQASSGKLERVLTGHTDEVYVLESHPLDKYVMLSAGHDGQFFIWDILKGEIINRFINTIEGQGFGAIYDGKWSPDGDKIALSDSHGRILVFGFGTGNPLLQTLPLELFFHTDYRPLMRDANNYVLDEQTQVSPHMMAPPFLVDIDGNPYPPHMQRLVPGREHCNNEQLIPNIVVGNEGRQEVFQGIILDERQDIERQYLHLQMQDIDNSRNNSSNFRNNARRRSRDNEGIRQSTGDWQRDPNIKWKKNILIPPMKYSDLKRVQLDVESLAQVEVDEYHKQMRQRPHMINTSSLDHVVRQKLLNEKKKVKRKPLPRPVPTVRYLSDHTESEEEDDDNSQSDSSGYSDWLADEGMHLEPPKRSKRRQVDTRRFVETDEDDDDDSDHDLHLDDDNEDTPRKDTVEKDPLEIDNPSGDTVTEKPAKKIKLPQEVPEVYKPSEWLSEAKPKKTPYFPQMGDELVYLVQGHQLYNAAVESKKLYPFNPKDLPYNRAVLKEVEYVKIIGIRYEIRPPRLCCLKVAIQDNTGKPANRTMTIKYHDMPDVLDFLVLKQTYEAAMARKWKPGDRFRCMIDDAWWLGEIQTSTLDGESGNESPFLCYETKWDNGETERMSPWDLEVVDENRIPEDPTEAVPVLEEELRASLYQPTTEDWPTDRTTACANILQGLSKIMELAIAEPFLVPVDLNVYPTYAYVIEYPIDLSTIRTRFENQFYRRVVSAQFDIRYLATNAEKFNEKASFIVKHSRILTDLCLRVVRDCTIIVDVSEAYRQLMDSYMSSDGEVDVENVEMSPSNRLAHVEPKNIQTMGQWKKEALKYLNIVFGFEDSIPFRHPVNHFQYPDYQKVVQNPIDLTTIKEKCQNDVYRRPEDFAEDMKLLFKNSRHYNTNRRSKIFYMTQRLDNHFELFFKKLSKYCAEIKFSMGTRVGEPVQANTSDDSSSDEDLPLNNFMSNVSQPGPSRIQLNDIKESEEDEHSSSDISVKKPSPSNRRMTRTQANSRSQQSSRNASEKEEEEDEESESDFHDSPKRRTPRNSDSESDFVTETDTDQSEPKTRHSKRNSKRKTYKKDYSDSSDNESDEPARKLRTRRKKNRKYMSDTSEDSEVERPKKKVRNSKQNGQDSLLSSVSSKGRVRKLTPRVQSFLKNK